MGPLIYLLDSNVVSELGKAGADREVVKRFTLHERRSALCAPSVHELLYGLETLPHGGKRLALTEFLSDFLAGAAEILPYDAAAARWHATARAALGRQGLTPSFVDGQIAAIAGVNDLILVTRNTPDFKNFSGLRLENWFGR
jgi:tRNA(fMet)-specific endonuclease VapC